MILRGLSAAPLDTPTETIRARLAVLPQFTAYTQQLDAALAILDKCRRWLTDDTAPILCSAAFRQNDAIYQMVAFSSPARLADEVRQAADLDCATDMQAIAAFALACTLRALDAFNGCQTDDEIAELELYRAYLSAIAECVTSAGVSLSEDECEACNELGDLADEASGRASFKADGYWGELYRREETGADLRDGDIHKKALELIDAGTKRHNLSYKLRAWQQREIGNASSELEKQAILMRLGLPKGKALSKPAMNTILKRLGLFS